MKRIVIFGLLAIFALSLSSCVENSKKYRALQAQLDSLQADFGLQAGELDEVFATLNEIENGLRSIRESENIITVQSKTQDGLDVPANTKQQIREDMQAVQEAIKKYQKKIDELEKDKRIQSEQFRKRLAALSVELKEKNAMIESLNRQLDEKNAQLKVKTEQIASLDLVVSNLKEEVVNLNRESTDLKGKVASQEKEIFTVYYIVGSKSDLISAGVVTKGGLFKSAKVSYQAEKNSFIAIDYREINAINTNASKAKVLSIHPQSSYSMEDNNGEVILNITDPEAFWEQTKYLVIQTN